MKYDIKIEDSVRQIRAAVRDLPKGDRLLIEKRLDQISMASRKAIRRGVWQPDGPTSETYTPTQQQIADRYSAKKAVMQAMTVIRKDIEKKNLPYILCDEVFHFGEKNKPAKKYWIIPKEEDGLC